MIRPLNKDATATAIIKGLAIARYGHDQSKWEVTFLRNCGHYPNLRIRQLNRETGELVATLKKYEIQPGDNISLAVTSPKGNTPRRYVTRGAFDRNNNGHDKRDLRWMLDIDQLHGKKTRRRNSPIETNSLSVSDGCFYTAVRTRKSYRVKKIGSPEIKPLGLAGRTFGVDFEGGAVTVEVQGNNGFKETLPHTDNLRYEIIFDNTCLGETEPAHGETDFQFYYKFIDDSEGRVDILPPEEPDVIAFQEEPPDDEPEGDPPKVPACYAITTGEDPNPPPPPPTDPPR